MHGQIPGHSLKGLCLSDKVGLAVQLHQDADLSAHVDVMGDCAVLGGLGRPLGRRRHPLFSQIIDSLFKIAVRRLQRLFTLHHPGVGFISQGFNHFHSNIHFLPPRYSSGNPARPSSLLSMSGCGDTILGLDAFGDIVFFLIVDSHLPDRSLLVAFGLDPFLELLLPFQHGIGDLG